MEGTDISYEAHNRFSQVTYDLDKTPEICRILSGMIHKLQTEILDLLSNTISMSPPETLDMLPRTTGFRGAKATSQVLVSGSQVRANGTGKEDGTSGFPELPGF